MTMRYKNRHAIYNNTEDTPAPHDTAALENTPPTYSILEEDSEVPTEYDLNPQRH